jgi:hypothetical protein
MFLRHSPRILLRSEFMCRTRLSRFQMSSIPPTIPWTSADEAIILSDSDISCGPVWKSRSDDRNYRALALANGLRVLLISDPQADTAAAAMSVAVGHTSDPWDIPGLSHFLEHMLFLGTNKYPDEASYKRYLKDHGGGSNASTSAESTTYYFSVRHEHLEEAVDRFAQFFVAPLMTPSATEREVNAVDAEVRGGRLDLIAWASPVSFVQAWAEQRTSLPVAPCRMPRTCRSTTDGPCNFARHCAAGTTSGPSSARARSRRWRSCLVSVAWTSGRRSSRTTRNSTRRQS